MKHYFSVVTILILTLISSCSSSNSSWTSSDYYRIEYYVGGGFTGLTKGITITSGGGANFWQSIGTDSLVQQDSLELTEEQLESFGKTLQDSSIFSYKFNNPGNITTVLNIKFNKHSNKIAFEGTKPPATMPEKLNELINKIKNLYNRRKDKP
jgi:hypothetical protein